MSEITVDHARLDIAARPSPAEEPDDSIFRALDVTICMLALLFLLPLMVLVAAAVFLQDGGPVLFSHRRIGRGGRPFYCIKFRSMTSGAETRLAAVLASNPVARAEWARDHKLRIDPRVTPLGSFLRRSSLDELPQLLNVLRGEMSIVGPRPIVEAEISRYGRRFRHYCAVKPGITGLWQVNGRNEVNYRSRVAMDCLYVKSQSPWLYMWIVVATIPAVLTRKGSY